MMENVFETILNDQDDLICCFHLNGKIFFINKICIRFFGKKKADLIGLNFFEIIKKEDVILIKKSINALTQFNNVFSLEHNVVLNTGENSFQQCQYKLFTKDDLSYIQLVCKSTNQNFKEEADSAKNLIMLAKSESSAKSNFLASIGHEFRTPLNSIILTSDLLLHEIKNYNCDKQKEYLEYLSLIKNSGNDLTRLVNDLMDASRIDIGKVSIVKEVFNIKNLIGETVKSFDKNIKSKGLKFILNIEKGVPKFINADPLRIKQVLYNIIHNAIKFTQNGCVKVNVVKVNKPELKECELAELEFYISDTGIGIPSNRKQDLFKPFSQVHDVLKNRHYGGSGLGLSLSKNLIEIMGGKIYLENNVPQGSVFRFTIMVNLVEEKSYAIIEKNNDLDYAKNIVFNKSIELLIVEDDEPYVNVLKMALNVNKFKFNIFLATNGQQAIDIIKKQQIDFIMTDVNMPIMDGFSMIRQIRALELKSGNHIPIICMTAYAMEDDRERCLNSGADFYIPKPIYFTELEKLIGKVFIMLSEKL